MQNSLSGVYLPHRFYCVVISLVVCGGLATHAQAQVIATPFIGIGAMVNLEGGSADPPYLSGSLSGTAPAVDVIVGVRIFRQLAIAFEASIAAKYTADPQSIRTAVYERTHGDKTFSAVARVPLRNRLEAVGGITRVRVETDQVLIEGLRGPFAARHSGWSTGLVLGLDYNVLQWKVIALFPTARVFIFDHHDPYGDLPAHFGYGSYLVRLGVHAEARF